MSSFLPIFSDPQAVAGYTERPPKQVPGLHALHRMTALLLAEHVPGHGRVLVLGAGGGLELKAFAQAQPGWRLLGIDPSAPMLALAKQTLGPLAERVEFLEGLIDDAPDLAFDGASCLLTLHFLPEAQRLQTLAVLRRRLKPGSPLVVAHHSVPQSANERLRWLARSAAFAELPDAQGAAQAMADRLPLLSPEQDVALMRRAGFARIALFYAGFTFKGWVGYAA